MFYAHLLEPCQPQDYKHQLDKALSNIDHAISKLNQVNLISKSLVSLSTKTYEAACYLDIDVIKKAPLERLDSLLQTYDHGVFAGGLKDRSGKVRNWFDDKRLEIAKDLCQRWLDLVLYLLKDQHHDLALDRAETAWQRHKDDWLTNLDILKSLCACLQETSLYLDIKKVLREEFFEGGDETDFDEEVNSLSQGYLKTKSYAHIINPNAKKLDHSSVTDGASNFPSYYELPLIGREKAKSEILDMLMSKPNRHHLITVVGVGGTGKTHLLYALYRALQALTHDFYAIKFVELEAIQAHELEEILKLQLGIPKGTNFDSAYDLKGYKTLLILDNFEHLVDEAYKLIAHLLRAFPKMIILISSRDKLNLQSESIYELGGLDFPKEIPSLAKALDYPAIQLFCERRTQKQQNFFLNKANLAEVVALCQMTWGLPLALVLAASTVDKELSLADIKEQIRSLSLENHFRDRSDKHASLELAFEYSWRRLSLEEQSVYRQLAIFHYGFSKEAAQRLVKNFESYRSRLEHKSLLEFRKDEKRYRLHPLLRSFCEKKLQQVSEEKESLAKEHSHYYLSKLSEIVSEVKNIREMSYQQLGFELANIRTAWHYALEQGWVDEISQNAISLQRLYSHVMRYREGIELLEKAAELLKLDQQQRAIIQAHNAWLYFQTYKYEEAIQLGRKACHSLKHSLNAQNFTSFMSGLNSIVASYGMQGKFRASVAYGEIALYYAKYYHPQNNALLFDCHNNLAVSLNAQGDYVKALAHMNSLVMLSKNLTTNYVITLLNTKAQILLHQDSVSNFDAAKLLLEEAYALAEKNHAKSWLIRFHTDFSKLYLLQENVEAARASIEKPLNMP
ncbi:MAG: hypothetical protein R2865_12360 [Deinococcales bacterium]